MHWRRRFPPHRRPCQGQGMPCEDGLDETWKARVLILKWKTDGLATTRSVAKDSTTIWNGLYPRDPGNSEFGTNPGRQKMGRKSNLMKQSRFFWVHWYKNCFNACSRIKHGCPRWTTSAQKPLVFRLTRISRYLEHNFTHPISSFKNDFYRRGA